MDQNVVYGLVKRLALEPRSGSKLAVFLNRLENKSHQSSNLNDREDLATTEAIHDADQEIMDYLKRLQIITLTKPILALCAQVQMPQDINKVKAAGIDSIVRLPDQTLAKLNSLGKVLEESLKHFIEIKEVDAEELNKKLNLVVPPTGLEISVVLTLVVAAFTMLAFIMMKAEDMLGSSEAYWGFFAAGIVILFGINAVIINLIKLLRFKKNRVSIVAEAKRKFVEKAGLKHAKLKKKIEDESFQIQKIEYPKAAVLKRQEVEKEEQQIIKSLTA